MSVLFADQRPYLSLSEASSGQLNPNFVSGYEVRDPPLTFDLPFFAPLLPSQDNIIEMCGPLVYTVTIESAQSDRNAFTVTLTPFDDFTSASVVVFTTDQSYALATGLANKTYKTEYVFDIKAQFSQHPDQVTFATKHSFWIRDYCVAMSFDGLPLLTSDLQSSYNLTVSEKEPWTYSLEKYLMTEDSSLMLGFVNYKKW